MFQATCLFLKPCFPSLPLSITPINILANEARSALNLTDGIFPTHRKAVE